MVAQLPERSLGRMRTLPVGADAKPQHVALAKDNWFFYLFLFLLPLQNIQVGYLPNLGGGLNFLNVGFGLSLLGAMRCRGAISHAGSLQKWIFAYAGYAFFSLFIGYGNVHSNTEPHFNILKDSLLAIMLLFVTQMSVGDWTKLKRVIAATLLPMPYILRVTWAEHASVSAWHYHDDLRISGTFALLGANEFSAFCVTMTVLFFALLVATKWSWRWRIGLIGAMVCTVMGVIWMYSRTGYVTVLLGIATVTLLWRGRWKMIVPLAALALLLPGMLPESVVERFQSTSVEAGERDQSVQMRFDFWEIAWDNFKAHPLFGSGYHTFHHKEINPAGMDTHNFFMRELTEKGLVGIAITIAMLLSILAACIRVMRESPAASLAYALGLGMVAAWVALVVGNFFGDRFTYYPMIGYFWVYLGLMLKAFELAQPKQAPEVHTTLAVPGRRFAQPRPRIHE